MANINDVKSCIKTILNLPNQIDQPVLMIVGQSGVGKNHIVRDTAKEMGYGFIYSNWTGKESTDASGMPVIEDGKTTFLRPDFLPKEGKHLIYIDEVTRNRPDVNQVLLQLINEYRVGEHEVSRDCRFVLSSNPWNDEKYDVLEPDQALIDRVIKIDLETTAEDWAVWLQSDKCPIKNDQLIEDAIQYFVYAHPEYLIKSRPRKLTMFLSFMQHLSFDDSVSRRVIQVAGKDIISVSVVNDFIKFCLDRPIKLVAKDLLNGNKSFYERFHLLIKQPKGLEIIAGFCNSLTCFIQNIDKPELSQVLNLTNFIKVLADNQEDLAMRMLTKVFNEGHPWYDRLSEKDVIDKPENKKVISDILNTLEPYFDERIKNQK